MNKILRFFLRFFWNLKLSSLNFSKYQTTCILGTICGFQQSLWLKVWKLNGSSEEAYMRFRTSTQVLDWPF
jgi:hypothetical protein